MAIAKEFKRLFNDAIVDVQSADEDLDIHYVPMCGCGSHSDQTKLHPDQKSLDLTPRLDPEIFYSGSSDEAVREYCRGLKLALELLPGEHWPEFNARMKVIEQELGVQD